MVTDRLGPAAAATSTPDRMAEVLRSRVDRACARCDAPALSSVDPRRSRRGETRSSGCSTRCIDVAVEPQVDAAATTTAGSSGRADLLVTGTPFVHEYDGAHHRAQVDSSRVDLRRDRGPGADGVRPPRLHPRTTCSATPSGDARDRPRARAAAPARAGSRGGGGWSRTPCTPRSVASGFDEPLEAAHRASSIGHEPHEIWRRIVAVGDQTATSRASRDSASESPTAGRRLTIVDRRIFGIENEYGVTCTFRGQRRLSPGRGRPLPVPQGRQLGPQQQRLPPQRRPALPRRRQPPRVRHARVRRHRRAGHPRQGGGAGPRGAAPRRRAAAARRGHRRRDLPVQEQHRLRRQLLRLPRELPRRPRGRVHPARRRADPVPGDPADRRRRRQDHPDPAGRELLREPARRAHLGGRLAAPPPGAGRSSTPATSRTPTPRSTAACTSSSATRT